MEGCDSETLPGNSSALTVREGGINLITDSDSDSDSDSGSLCQFRNSSIFLQTRTCLKFINLSLSNRLII